jgi:hypothetical protein
LWAIPENLKYFYAKKLLWQKIWRLLNNNPGGGA